MVTIALKSEVLFAIIGVGAVFVTVCFAAALCYACHRRRGRSKGGGMQGEITEDIALTELPARAHSRREGERKTTEMTPGDVLLPVEEETKIAAPATSFRLEPPSGLPTSTPLPVQPRFSQSARLDPQLFQQTFSTYESLYRAQSETAASVPPSPHSASGAWPVQSTARTRETSRLTNATLADIALRLPSTPTELSLTGTWTVAAQEPDRASSTTASVRPQRSRTHKSMPDIISPPTAGSPRLDAFQATEVPSSPRPLPTAGARGSPAGGSALASRPRSRSIGSSTIPPPASGEVRGAGQRYPPPVARSKGAVTKYPARSLESSGGDIRHADGVPFGAPLAKSASASNVSRPLQERGSQPRSYFDD